MTATMTMASAPLAPIQPLTTTATSSSTTACCPQCGTDLEDALLAHLPAFADTQAALLDAHAQIADLQAQVRILNQKAAAAVDRWADYEDELRKLRAQLEKNNKRSSFPGFLAPATPPDSSGAAATSSTSSSPDATAAQRPTTPSRAGFLTAGGAAATRISALLSSRKSTPNLKHAPPLPSPLPSSSLHAPSNSLNSVLANADPAHGPFSPAMPLSPTPSADELAQALTREQSLRIAAEGKLNDTSREVEELSVKLFEQANEMVASERRARAKLEERVEMLEKRDVDKRRRLDRLESAMERIERVRVLLGQAEGGAERK